MISAIFLLINRFCFESMDIIIERHISNNLNFFCMEPDAIRGLCLS